MPTWDTSAYGGFTGFSDPPIAGAGLRRNSAHRHQRSAAC